MTCQLAGNGKRCCGIVVELLVIAVLSLAMTLTPKAQELLTNGDFETGTFDSWTVDDQEGGSGSFFIDVPGSNTPLTSPARQIGFVTTPGSEVNGAFYTVSDQLDPGTHALSQRFTVPVPQGTTIVTLSFDMFVNDQSQQGPIINPGGLDFFEESPPPELENQHARVDILTGAATPFDTGAGVLGNFYLGVDDSEFGSGLGIIPNPFTSYQFDITALVGAGGTFQVRFAEVDNLGSFHQGVDNVSVFVQVDNISGSAPTETIPTLDWRGFALLIVLLLLCGVIFLRRQQF